MWWQNFCCCILVLSNVANLIEARSLEENSVAKDYEMSRFPKVALNVEESAVTIFINSEPSYQRKPKAEPERTPNEIEQILQAQSQLNQTIVEISGRLSAMQKANEELSAELSPLNLKFLQLLENSTTDVKEEMLEYVQNALEVNKKPLPTEFDENLNLVYRSNELPNDCEEALNDARHRDGVFILKPKRTSLRPFGAFCQRHENEGWTIIQRRQDGSVDFNRNWEAYKKGFGNLSGEYWLGLDRIHALTSKAQHELWIEVKTDEQETVAYRCQEFSVGNESESFGLQAHCSNELLWDIDVRSDDAKFSTFDNSNLAFRPYDEGWWSDWFEFGYLNGPINSIETYANGLPKYAHMAIRQV